MKSKMQLSIDASAVRQFAEWSGDCNPLHVDPDIARQTYFGRQITHGVLGVLETLGHATEGTVGQRAVSASAKHGTLSSLDVEFRGAIYPDESYDVVISGDKEASERCLSVNDVAGRAVMIVRAEYDSGGTGNEAGHVDHTENRLDDPTRRPENESGQHNTSDWFDSLAGAFACPKTREAPVDHSFDELARLTQISGVYPGTTVPEDYLANGGISPLVARVLALCSYLVGMEVPGRRSLFTRLKLQFHDNNGNEDQPAPALGYLLRPSRLDPKFRILDTTLEVRTSDGTLVATGEVRSYVPFSPARTDLDDLAASLAPDAKQLGGKVAVVIGGSRGLGADIAAALATAGCHVYATYRSSQEETALLKERLHQRGGDVEFVQGDAGDEDSCRKLRERILNERGKIDILVLNACAPPGSYDLVSSGGDQIETYVANNLRLVRTPLASFLPAIDANEGVVIAVSSSAVVDPPADFPHYVALKQAVEGIIHVVSRQYRNTYYLLPRPPQLQTHWNDTPTRVLGAIPTFWVASRIVNAMVAPVEAGKVNCVDQFSEPQLQPVPTSCSDMVDPIHADVRLAVAATFTAEPIVPALRSWFDRLDVRGAVQIASYGQVLQELLNPTSLLSANTGGINIVLLRVEDWLRELPESTLASHAAVVDFLATTVNDFIQAVRTHRQHARTETLLVLCPITGAAPSESVTLLTEAEQTLRQQLDGLPGLTMIFVSDFHQCYGVDEADIADPLRNQIGHIPYRDDYYCVLGTVVMRHVFHRITPPRKVVVTDCDNTLWRGIVGEVGPAGIAFDESHRRLHALLARLSESGILVCLCSKNEEDDVWRVFESRTDLSLERDQIVAAKINWQPKSQNIRSLAEGLNLGLDSFIFLDDNPMECAEVRAGCPEVLTLQWPTETENALKLLEHTWEFDIRGGTDEDRRRTRMYQEEVRRQELKQTSLSFDDFLESLGLVVDIRLLADADVPRASQLTLRTNQFNFTTRRRTEAELQAAVGEEGRDCWTVHVRDRFGDYGFVGLLITATADDTLVVDTFLLSCRVLGRGVEHRMAAEIGRIARERGLSTVSLRVDFTKRNVPARTFLESLASEEDWRLGDDYLETQLPSEQLAAVEFQPAGQATETTDDNPPSEHVARDVDDVLERTRKREQQIEDTAFRLASIGEQAEAILGQRGGEHTGDRHASAAESQDEVADFVYGTFGRELSTSRETLEQVDQLDQLGCDSFKIVEITVALIARFPWLPTTLLFEHPCVSAIVEHVCELARAGGQASQNDACLEPAVNVVAQADVELGTDIAVVGLDVRCAGADSAEQFWELLRDARSAVKPVPPDRPFFLGRLNDHRSHWAGLMNEVDGFDCEFFGISPREAEYLDPQLRLLLEVAWRALEDAGGSEPVANEETGVFMGVMYGDYRFQANLIAEQEGSPYRCWEGFSVANRLSQIMGFHGPSFAVDTACSSSGTAIHMACHALALGECRMGVVGGVNLILDPNRFAQLARLGILSPTGNCCPFGAEADGTVLGEGAGVVVLRRLDEAISRGDHIYGVIKGTGVGHGTGTVGFTAPNPIAQAEAIRRALTRAKVDPRTISFVETHGTGTSLGDPIEIRGLELAYGDRGLWDQDLHGNPNCRVGAIKPNAGHLEAGAGMLGLIKVLLQLEHGEMVPTRTSDLPNPQIPFDRLPFAVQRKLEEWERPVMEQDGKAVSIPRRAGVSCFGVGGANVHIIVEEAETESDQAIVDETEFDRTHHLLVLSSRHPESLALRARQVAQYVEENPELPISDVAYSTNVGRRLLEERLAVTAADREELVRRLLLAAEGQLDDGCHRSHVSSPDNQPSYATAFLFTGQGAQYAGMGRLLYQTQPVFRRTLDRCAEQLDNLLDRPLLDVMFAERESEDATRLDHTAYTQPALFAIEYALAELWRWWGVTPQLLVGHSIGEIAAICFAGGLDLDDALKLVAARGRLMGDLPAGGGMMACRCEPSALGSFLADYQDQVSIAAVNSPGQTVISGTIEALDAITAELETNEIQSKRLNVSHAFHSPLMDPMLAEFESVVRGCHFQPPKIPLVSTVTGRLASTEFADPSYWVRQVRATVRFADAAKTLVREGVRCFIEVGPQPVLLGMAQASIESSEENGPLWLPSLRKGQDDWDVLCSSVGQRIVHGGSVDCRAWDRPYQRHRVYLPPYPFRHRSFWIDWTKVAPSGVLPSADGASTEKVGRHESPSVEQMVYQLNWKPAESLDAAAPADRQVGSGKHWVILADEHGFAEKLAETLRTSGSSCTLVHAADTFQTLDDGTYAVSPEQQESLERLWGTLSKTVGGKIGRIVNLWPIDVSFQPGRTGEDIDQARNRCLHGLLRLMQSLAARYRQAGDRPRVWAITRGAMAADDLEANEREVTCAAVGATVWGFGRTAALEMPDYWGGSVDIDAPTDESISSLAAELLVNDGEDQVVLRDGKRRVARLTRAAGEPTAELPVRDDGRYLITGGLGALGLHVARWLVLSGVKHLALVSRRGEPSDDGKKAIEELERYGATVELIAADVSDERAVVRLLTQLRSDAIPFRGVFHVAGIDEIKPLDDLTTADVDRVTAAKVRGGWLLHKYTHDDQLDCFVCFSSLAGILGAAHRAHYAAANAFLDALVAGRARQHPREVVLSIAWGPWRGGGMADEATLEQFQRIGNRGLDPEMAVTALGLVLRTGMTMAVVADIDWDRFRAAYEARGVRPLIAEVEAPSPSKATTTVLSASWLETLAKSDLGDRENRLVELLRAELAELLQFPDAESVAPDRGFGELGMDSLIAVEFAMRLQRRMGVSGPAVFDHPNVRALAAVLLRQVNIEDAAAQLAVGANDYNGNGKPRRCASFAPAIAGQSCSADLVSGLPGSEQTERIEAVLREEAAKSLGYVDPDDVQTQRNLFEQGMDSLMVVDFATRVNKRLGCGSPALVFDAPTIASLATRLAQEFPSTPAAPRGIVGYTAELEPQVFEFARRAWRHRPPESIAPRWKWMFVKSAERLGLEPRVWLYRGGDRIIGHMGAIPVRIQAGSEELTTAWFVEMMVEQSCRDRAIGSAIMLQSIEEMPFSLSLGQTAYMRKMLTKIGWQQVEALRIYAYVLNASRALAGKFPLPGIRHGVAAALLAKQRWLSRKRRLAQLPFETRTIQQFGPRHDVLWDTVRENHACSVVRDSSYLNWKYAQQPFQTFECLEVLRDNRVVGVVVLQFREPGTTYCYRRGIIVDLLVDARDEAAVMATLDAAVKRFRQREVDLVTCHIISEALEPLLRRYGFWPREPSRHLLVRPGDVPENARRLLVSPGKWFITKGDSDIDRP